MGLLLGAIGVALGPWILPTSRAGRARLSRPDGSLMRLCGAWSLLWVSPALVLALFAAWRSGSAAPLESSIAGLVVCTIAMALPPLMLPRLRGQGSEREVTPDPGTPSRFTRVAHLLSALAAVATTSVALLSPNFVLFALRSKSGEAPLVLASIRDAEERYFEAFGQYLEAGPKPSGTPGSLKRQWIAPDSGFRELSVAPEGPVYCVYAVRVGAPLGSPDTTMGYTAEAVCDLDGDGTWQAWGIVKPAPGAKVGIPGPFGFCSVRGAIPRGADQPVLSAIGRCDPASGQSVF